MTDIEISEFQVIYERKKMTVDFKGMFCYSPKPRDIEADAHIEGNLAAEVTMVTLDTLELIIQVGKCNDWQIYENIIFKTFHLFGY